MTPDLIVTLGDFEFRQFEVPQEIQLGGGQALAIHRLVGGSRIIDAMGQDPAPLSWSGWFIGPDALDRALYLDTLRARGEELELTFSRLVYRVVISSFQYRMQREYQLAYSLTLEVIEDMNLGVTSLSVPSVTETINADITTAQVLVDSVGTTQMRTSFSGLRSIISGISDFAKATQSQINSVLAPIAEFRSLTQDLIATTNNTIQNVTTLGGVLPNNPIAQQASQLLDQVNAMNSYPQMVQLDNVLGRVQTNVSNATTGSRTVTVGTGTLFDLAAREYGDAQAWTTIARANGLSDPLITSPMTLLIPARPDNTGGVLNG